jgi:hypothetical protein
MIELLQNQRKDIPSDKKLLYNDLKRISKYLPNSIFNDNCSLWNGYITSIKGNNNENQYINFYFKGKKHALHRLLYINFIGELNDNEYIKFKCANKGKCCNIHHFYKNDSGHSLTKSEKDNLENNILDIMKKNIKPIIVKF